ncbi:MAG: sel1 repeat family protein [Idiomarina sp.]|nr:sel1 repeat family protein [Idiomarina sp.]
MQFAVIKGALLASSISLALFGISANAQAASTTMFITAAAQTSERVCDSTECTAELRRLMRLARNGSGDAAAIVAMAFASGDGLEQSDKEAERFVRIGVRYNSPIATYLMSDWHRNGFVLEQNEQEADRLLDVAVNLGHPPAQYQKALMLFSTDSAEDFNEALTLLEAASEQNLVTAMMLLGRMKQIGAGVDEDLVGAGELYRKLIIAGVDDARGYLREVTRELEARDDSNDEVINRFANTTDMEVITVRGSAFRVNTQLTGIVRRLTASGNYDSRSIGSRIRGVTCEQSGSNCAVNRPDPTAASLDDVIGNN